MAGDVKSSDPVHTDKTVDKPDLKQGGDLNLDREPSSEWQNCGFSNDPCASDEDVLNFLLNIAYLGATFYILSITGHGLDPNDTGADPGTTIGGSAVSFANPTINAYALEMSKHKTMHVRALQELLGEEAVSCPNLDLRNSFNWFGQATFGQNFDPFANDTNLLLGAYVFEDVGVSAYRAALCVLRDSSHVEIVSGMLVAEAHHAALVRLSLFATRDPFISNVTMAIAQTRSALANNGNPNVDDIGIGNLLDPHVVNSQYDQLNALRSTSQILNILYGDSGRIGAGGAFFPNGLAGKIR